MGQCRRVGGQRTERARKAREKRQSAGLSVIIKQTFGWGYRMPRGNKAIRDAHSAISLCLSPSITPPSPEGPPPRGGRHLRCPHPHPSGESSETRLEGRMGAQPGARVTPGARWTPCGGWPLWGPGAAHAEGEAGVRGASGPAAPGEAPATHVLRVPLIHRRQWRPRRHFVRAAGSGRGLAGRAAGPGSERQGLRPRARGRGRASGSHRPRAVQQAAPAAERGERTRRKRRGSRFPRRRRRGTRAGTREGCGRGRLPVAGRAARPAGCSAEAGRRGGSRGAASGPR